ncbi:OLC1v1037666C1 [Oldenlandia corymbosa var. corymbosa]|uniref:OLC1v1037666C1 n=1 Tax=Oldenlandia corymbosa var. corymbosa TaxID=529605 RepID=A0AAV1D1Q7_OLDCO|nr:OLC1v1037666C1 [Oldenlandia corymbosa var. corymbosa]
MTSAIVYPSIRLKREECRRTKHDSAFSPWKVLIGPSDWEDYAMGKEGAERYRTQNLPNCTSCTGVYELGVTFRRRGTGRDSGKIDPDFVIPVYLGKADNVRNRMQQYGREGAHLEIGTSNGRFNDSCEILVQKGPGVFKEIFSKGFSIVYRWAPMENIRDAEKTESDLLEKFDYAWNKGSNGNRRRNDILKKLGRISKPYSFLTKLQIMPQQKKGIKIKVSKQPSLHNGLDFYSNLETNGFLHRIFKFGRSQPRLVVRPGLDDDCSGICGVALGHGVICKRPPTEGNKRCIEHKGMKVNGFTSRDKDSNPVCGFLLDDGSSCTSKPLHGNKRCLEHKGRKIRSSVNRQQMKDKKVDHVHSPVYVSPPSEVVKHCIENGDSRIECGVELGGGTYCTRQPPRGRKRCEEHTGMRIKRIISTSSPSSVERNTSRKEGPNGLLFIPAAFIEGSSPTCGAALQNGSFCSRKTTKGNKRCWQHYGMKVNSCPRISPNEFIYGQSSSQASIDTGYEKCSSTCGAPTRNGSHCRRKVSGGRCWQHGGYSKLRK